MHWKLLNIFCCFYIELSAAAKKKLDEISGSWNIFQSSIIDEPRIRKKSRKYEEGTQEEDAEISKKSKKLDVEVKEIPQKNHIQEKESATKKSKKKLWKIKKIQKTKKKMILKVTNDIKFTNIKAR